jgi:glucose/arabinose dehydrogenase
LVFLVTATVARASGVCDGVSEAFNSDLARVTVASGLTAGTSGPLFVTAPPGDTTRIFIVMQNGVIRQLARGAQPTASTVFLDIDPRVGSNGDEQGLLGLAFDPAFLSNGTFYVSYTRASDGDNIVSRFRTIGGDPKAVGDPNSERILYRIDDAESNHNGGWMSFGPDGMLYIGQGDGGGGGDAHGLCGNGQNLQSMLGKIIRIDPRGAIGVPPDCALDAGPYNIPAGNPFADGPGGACDEIWAYGLRNPWRSSFDTATGDLYIGDVGQGCWEEIDWTPGGGHGGENYGWRLFEGRHCYNSGQGCQATTSPIGCGPACSDPLPSGDPVPNGTRQPIWDYSSSVGSACAVTGGYVYRGCRMPNFRGTYFYGDYCAGNVASFVASGGVATNPRDWTVQLGSGLPFGLTSFGTDAQGELYITDRDGFVYAVVPPLNDMEVAGTGSSSPLRLEKAGDWTWEDLFTSSWQPVASYRVYRAMLLDGHFDPGEIFNCVRTGPQPRWPGGDPASPFPGEMYAYVVTAVDAGGKQTSPGGSPVRTLGAATCP